MGFGEGGLVGGWSLWEGGRCEEGKGGEGGICVEDGDEGYEAEHTVVVS